LWPLTSTVPSPTCFKGSSHFCEGNWPQIHLIPTRIGVVAMKSLSDDPESLCLVKECRAQIPFQHRFYYRDPNWCGLHWPSMHKESYQKDWQRSEVGKVCLEGPSNCPGCESWCSWSPQQSMVQLLHFIVCKPCSFGRTWASAIKVGNCALLLDHR